MGQTLLALCLLGLIVMGAIYSARSYNPHIDFNSWHVELQLLMHEQGLLLEASLFDQEDWIDAWYRGETPEQALNNKYGSIK